MAIPPPAVANKTKKRRKISSKKDFIRLLILRTIGNFLVLFTIFGIVFTFGPMAYYEVRFRIDEWRGKAYVLASDLLDTDIPQLPGTPARPTPTPTPRPGSGFLGTLLSQNPTTETISPRSTQFSIVIPKIGANQIVIENVDPENKDEYTKALESGIAHAKGTSFPGYGGTTYLFAHSGNTFWETGRNNAEFYLLKELQNGDEINIFFENKRHAYEMVDKKIIDPDDVHYLTSDRGVGEELILQTCWPPGTAWKRLLIFAKPKAL